jgi:hypothetical protein
MPELSDFVRAPNQADDPELYEAENAAVDPDGVLAAALWSAAPWEAGMCWISAAKRYYRRCTCTKA